MDIDLDKAPTPAQVAEDAGRPEGLRAYSVDLLLELREEEQLKAKEAYAQAGKYLQELERRAREAQGDSSTVVLVGERNQVTIGWNQEWEYNPRACMNLPLKLGPDGKELFTASECQELLSWEPKVNGTAFNKLAKRGSFWKEALDGLRTLKRTSLRTPEVKPRG